MNSRLNNAEELISDLEDRIMEITQSSVGRKTNFLKKERKATFKIYEVLPHTGLNGYHQNFYK